MALRIAFDLDGVLADLDAAYRELEARVLAAKQSKHDEGRSKEQSGASAGSGGNSAEASSPGNDTPSADSARPVASKPEADARPVLSACDTERAWQLIEQTHDFWTTLAPLEDGVVSRIQDLAKRHRWDVVFWTQRPPTAGDTIQRQTQRWLAAQGFEYPSVIVTLGSRGKIANALHLDYVVDDLPKHCLDVISESTAKAVLVVRDPDEVHEQSAKRVGIKVVSRVSECLDMLEQVETTRGKHGTLVERLKKRMGIG